MVFITTGQRIATENFADGVIYKVVFSDSSIAYMMCVGIGQDFVMLQGPNPSLFCLTMSSASRVSTIDIHDPTPPEPPTPLKNVLQYQNGEPPFTFTTTTSKLFSWDIEGPCGDETANLYNYQTVVVGKYIDANGVEQTSSSTGHQTLNHTDYVEVTAGENYYFKIQKQVGQQAYSNAFCWFTAEKQLISRDSFEISSSDEYIIATYTAPTNAAYLIINFRDNYYNTGMLNVGSTALPFEPYGYKIPISCNSNKTTIYLDAPLGEGEKLYSVNIDTEITTDIGENTLTVDTTDTPTMQIVYDIYAEG